MNTTVDCTYLVSSTGGRRLICWESERGLEGYLSAISLVRFGVQEILLELSIVCRSFVSDRSRFCGQSQHGGAVPVREVWQKRASGNRPKEMQFEFILATIVATRRVQRPPFVDKLEGGDQEARTNGRQMYVTTDTRTLCISQRIWLHSSHN